MEALGGIVTHRDSGPIEHALDLMWDIGCVIPLVVTRINIILRGPGYITGHSISLRRFEGLSLA
jgi:hypothetical protein